MWRREPRLVGLVDNARVIRGYIDGITRERRMQEDWHALTAIEIAVATPGRWDRLYLAALTARLCQQATSWDDRTQNPAPVHLAERPDLDHPQRREQPSSDDDH